MKHNGVRERLFIIWRNAWEFDQYCFKIKSPSCYAKKNFNPLFPWYREGIGMVTQKHPESNVEGPPGPAKAALYDGGSESSTKEISLEIYVLKCTLKICIQCRKNTSTPSSDEKKNSIL